MNVNGCKTVLVVDDEPDICEMLEFALAMKGFRVIGVFSRDEALNRLLTDESPDAILMDYCMPGLGAREFIDRVAALRVPAPIVLMTAASDSVRRARDLGLSLMLEKPFNYEILMTVLEVCTRQSTRSEADLAVG